MVERGGDADEEGAAMVISLKKKCKYAVEVEKSA
jgi:hypothetical protein